MLETIEWLLCLFLGLFFTAEEINRGAYFVGACIPFCVGAYGLLWGHVIYNPSWLKPVIAVHKWIIGLAVAGAIIVSNFFSSLVEAFF